MIVTFGQGGKSGEVKPGLNKTSIFAVRASRGRRVCSYIMRGGRDLAITPVWTAWKPGWLGTSASTGKTTP